MKSLINFILIISFSLTSSCFDLFPTTPVPQVIIIKPSGSKVEDLAVINEIKNLNGITKSIDSLADTYNERITILWLGRLGIDTIPPSIVKMGALKLLLLDSNNILSLPSEIQNMERLEYVTLAKNGISIFPEALLFIESLKQLDISNNNISNIPQAALTRYYIYDYTFCMGPCGGPDCCSTTQKNGLNLNYNCLCDLDSSTILWINKHYAYESLCYPSLGSWQLTQKCNTDTIK
jgi:Leucine-rich repeat (LRR) protein